VVEAALVGFGVSRFWCQQGDGLLEPGVVRLWQHQGLVLLLFLLTLLFRLGRWGWGSVF